MISFDTDVAANVKVIRRQMDQGNVVGYITANTPDFEFANFTIEEMVDIAASIDEALDYSGDAVRNADWALITGGKKFEEQYVLVSARKPNALKGDTWGKALATYAINHPERSDTGQERPFCVEVRVALTTWMANYNWQKAHCSFDPHTFAQVFSSG
jgi:hypothetical protein